MLAATFQHLKGIGPKKEHAFWRSNIFSWDDLEAKLEPQLSLFAHSSNGNGSKAYEFRESKKALAENDTEFFARTLRRQQHYRIALNYPADTLFLDIETTGLSRYYDTITLVGWSIGDKYSVYVKGGDESPLRNALHKAKAIVTFNGTMFDLPFLSQEFSDLQIPSAHVDLRFFARRVGVSGGQKKIENILGIERPAFLEDVVGETAPLLWYRFIRGDLDGLKLLVSYNRADVEGMKRIFNSLIPPLLDKEQIPQCLRPVARFPVDLKNSEKMPNISAKRSLEQYTVQAAKALSLKSLLPKSTLSHLRVIGIDLTGSEARPSGWCLLEGEQASTRRIGPDAEIITATIEAQPALVSIDSPLSLPQGRTSVSDDDPGRKEYGITRYCERQLKKRGINVYPCLIPSMQALSARGMRLATELRRMGIPVIESYPGAAQDIMNIPRKRAGLEFLSKGLAEFGVEGKFTTEAVSHDELDAITSAVVGIFFWSGKFEVLGNGEEESLIIPGLNITAHGWRRRKVIGLSGPIASGKTTAGQFLESQGFHYGRFSLVLADILRDRGQKLSRRTLQQLGDEINKNPGQRWLCRKLVQKLPEKGNLVIDGLRFPDDHALLVETFGPAFIHIHIDSPDSVRRERFVKSGGTGRDFDKASTRRVEAQIDKLASLAHTIIENSSGKKTFLSRVASLREGKKSHHK